MDSITQAVLGATVQGAILGRWQGRKALIYGAILGTLPDMDVLIDFGDAVADMTYHRGFSHSLFVLGLLSIALTCLIRRYRPHPGYSDVRLFLCILLIFFTHVLLDSFTTYGTQLLWPIPSTPIAWSSIFIIDPLYTLMLLLAVLTGLIAGMKRFGIRAQYILLALSSLYLGSTLVSKQMADNRLESALTDAGIDAQITFSAPTPFNTLLWRVVAIDGDDYYEGLVSWLDADLPRLERLPRNASAAADALRQSEQHDRLRWFTEGILRYDLIEDQWVVTDLRLGLPGYHPFRFALARRDSATGEFVAIEHTEYWPTPGRDLERLRPLARRAFDESVQVPIAEMAAEMTVAP